MHEETRVGPSHVDVVFALPPRTTRSGYCVFPVVGLLRAGFAVAATRKFASIFFACRALLQQDRLKALQSTKTRGAGRPDAQFEYHGQVIWGITARLLDNLRRRLQR